MGAVKQWLEDVADETAKLMEVMSGGRISRCEARGLVDEALFGVDYDVTKLDLNALVDEAMELEGRTGRTKWLNKMRWEFDEYMRYEMWDKMTYDGIYEDDAWKAIGAFIEFCEDGYVTDDDGHPFFVCADGNVRDYEAAVNLMDEELREELRRTMSNSTPQEFIERYAKEHREKFGEGFAPYEGGAW